ncbi:AarF/ABC1/UbiB kinase family protein [Nocardia yamanashiensis]|uniref:ABC1 kinase family protein n=1 Tax=Nocardia yamanashiensis TaxID=209247 RepID=UPI001E452643|nr:AarF/ABC1/UbiB kinase family protein [Nocardia yamanashiensis]UGT44701.1 AarF/ABC1/UbiB kinase family protein [Nocardia yamanashiensis]
MSFRRTGTARGTRDAGGNPPARKVVRSAKLAALPVAFAGRRMAGASKKALGRPAREVDHDIRLRTAEHMFEVLGELKGCAAKLGQLLAVYELALPPDLAEPYRNALSRLQDAAPPMLPATVHAVLAASLGPDWRTNFREFDDRRAASATIGQVHRAVWQDGRRVAVKIMYPGARDAVLSDLDQLRGLSWLAPVFLPNTDVPAALAALSDCVRAELDYAAEAANQRAFAAAYADDPDFHVPAVIAQRGDVIVGEWLDGVPLTRLVTAGAQTERDRVGMLAIRFVLSSADRCGLLYGDPHPGNFRVLPDGRLGVVDFGACSPWPPPQFQPMVHDLFDALVNGTPADLDAAARTHGLASGPLDARALATELMPFTELLRHPTFRLDTGWLRERVLAAANPSLTNVYRQLGAPAYITPFQRALLGLVGLACQLGTTGPIRDEILRWSPELTTVMTRYAERADRPADLTLHRLRRGGDRTRGAAAG